MNSVQPLREPLLVPTSANNARVATRLPFRVWLHVYGASLSGILLGYDLCFIASILLPVQRDLQLCPTCNQASDKSLAHCACALKQFAVSACHVGAIIGGLFGGSFADAFGRRIAILVTDVCFIIGALAMALATAGPFGPALFLLGRAVSGVGLGAGGAVASEQRGG